MEYTDFKKLIDALTAKPTETEWVEFKHNFHSKEEIGERISALSNSAYLCSMPFGYIVFGGGTIGHMMLSERICIAKGKWLVMRNWSHGFPLD